MVEIDDRIRRTVGIGVPDDPIGADPKDDEPISIE